jgi:hypothetical protein
VVTFPSHTTHLLQPLDVGVFSSFKASLRQNSSSYSKLEIEPIPDTKFSDAEKNLYKIIINSLDSLSRAATLKNITNAFSKTGIYPVNEKAPLTNKFIIKDASVHLDSKFLKKGSKRINISGELLSKEKLDILSKSKNEKVSSTKKKSTKMKVLRKSKKTGEKSSLQSPIILPPPSTYYLLIILIIDIAPFPFIPFQNQQMFPTNFQNFNCPKTSMGSDKIKK